jgi:hypothetical protein
MRHQTKQKLLMDLDFFIEPMSTAAIQWKTDRMKSFASSAEPLTRAFLGMVAI